jgi:hypothetical protein
VDYTDFFQEPIEPNKRPSISWFYPPESGQLGLVEIDGDLWLVEHILGDLEGFDGPQQVGFTFKALAGGQVTVYFLPGCGATCSCGMGLQWCRHIEALRRMND